MKAAGRLRYMTGAKCINRVQCFGVARQVTIRRWVSGVAG